MTTVFSKDGLNDLVNNSDVKLVIVKFGAEWCGPCKNLRKTIESIDNKDVVFGDIDVDEYNDSLDEFHITSIPVMLFYKDGMIVDKTIGSMSKAQLENKIAENIEK